MPGFPFNKTHIISNAFILLGKPKISSIAAGGPVAADAEELYDMLMSSELSNPDWRFATTVQQLSKIAGLNPDYKHYTAAYQKPAGLLAIWQIYPKRPYEIFGNRIWTTGESTTIQCEYRELTEESKMPPAFLSYFTYVLAYNLGIGLTEHDHILSRLQNEMNLKRSLALAVNSQEAPNKAIQDSPWVTNRTTGVNSNLGGF